MKRKGHDDGLKLRERSPDFFLTWLGSAFNLR